MATRRLKRRARSLAAAQNAPAKSALHGQIHAAKRESKSEAGALRSEGRALGSSIQGAKHDLMSIPGLTGGDRRLALEQVAQDKIAAAGGIAEQQNALRRDTRGTVQDLRSQLVDTGVQQGADYEAALSQLISDAQSRRHDTAMTKLSGRIAAQSAAQSAKAEIAKVEALAKKHLTTSGSYTPGSKGAKKAGGLTPYEQRGVSTSRSNAMSLLHSALAESHSAAGTGNASAINRAIAAGKTPPAPTNPGAWKAYLDALYGKYHTTVDHRDLAWAAKQIRPHPQGNLPFDVGRIARQLGRIGG